MANEDKATRMGTVCILKLLNTGCSTKKDNNTASFKEHLNFF